MQRRNSYSDFGLFVAVSVFICILVKCLLFGFTWVSLVWLVLACAYFFVSWRYSSASAVVKHSTTAFLLFSLFAVVGIVMFDRNARPVMHAFEGTGDTIQDAKMVEEEPIVPIYVAEPIDTTELDTMPVVEYENDTLLNYSDDAAQNVESDTIISQP